MIPEPEVRQLLIESCHSSVEAQRRLSGELDSADFIALLVRIAVDADDYQGDAPMQAAYYLSQASPQVTKSHEAALVALLETADGYAGSVAVALGRMKSKQARPIIEMMRAEGCWPITAYTEALSFYEQA